MWRFLPAFLFRPAVRATFPPGEGFAGDRKGRPYAWEREGHRRPVTLMRLGPMRRKAVRVEVPSGQR